MQNILQYDNYILKTNNPYAFHERGSINEFSNEFIKPLKETAVDLVNAFESNPKWLISLHEVDKLPGFGPYLLNVYLDKNKQLVGLKHELTGELLYSIPTEQAKFIIEYSKAIGLDPKYGLLYGQYIIEEYNIPNDESYLGDLLDAMNAYKVFDDLYHHNIFINHVKDLDIEFKDGSTTVNLIISNNESELDTDLLIKVFDANVNPNLNINDGIKLSNQLDWILNRIYHVMKG